MDISKIENLAFEKFKPKREEICAALLELLGMINGLERSIFERDSEISEKFRKKELTADEYSASIKNLWNDYKAECKEIVEGRCTEKLLKKGYACSFSTTPMYGYIEDEDDCRGTFEMETAKKAVVEFRFHKKISPFKYATVGFMHKFVLVPSGDKWLVDAFSYGTEEEGVWHRGHI